MISTKTRGCVVVVMLAAGSVAVSQAPASAAGFGAAWQLNEKSGAVVDASGNGNNGTVHGGIIRTGSGYRFDGKTGYVSVPNSSSLNPGTASVTITVKFSLDGNPTPNSNSYDLIRKGVAGTRGGEYKVELLSSGTANCRFAGSAGSVSVRGGANLGVGTHTVRCVKTSGKVALYVDSNLKATWSGTVGSISNSSNVFLGAKPYQDFTDGLIDYIRVT